MSKRFFQVLAFLIVSSMSLQAQVTETNLSGSWLGKLSVGAVDLRIVFNLKLAEDGTYTATLDSPDQGASGIPVGPVTINNDSLIISAQALRAEYRALVVDGSEFKGTFTQMGNILPLDMEKQEEEFKLNRPQEPKEPFPYKVENVQFQNTIDDISLGGTLTTPEDGKDLTAVILVSGSGSQNRDEEIFGHKPFKVIADYLTRNGIAVLRYDDRGVAESGGNPIGATSYDFANDARAAIEYLMSHERISKAKIGIIGHSEGGLIAQLVAAEYKDIAFIISLAGQGTSGRDVLLDQVEYITRLSGVSDSINDQALQMNRNIYDLVEKYSDQEEGFGEILKMNKAVLEERGSSEEDIEQFENALRRDLGPVSYNWMRYFILSNPTKLLKKIKCPFLALNGEKDCQVLYKQNLAGIEKGLKRNKDVTAISFPELNHLFQHSTTGLVNEYGVIEETFSPEVLKIMSDWINKRF